MAFPSQNQGQGAQAFGTNAMKDNFVGPEPTLIAMPAMQQQPLSSGSVVAMAGGDAAKYGIPFVYPGKPDQLPGSETMEGGQSSMIMLAGSAQAGFEPIPSRPTQMGGNLFGINLGHLGSSMSPGPSDQPESGSQDLKEVQTVMTNYGSGDFAKPPSFPHSASYVPYLATSEAGATPPVPSSAYMTGAPGAFNVAPESKSSEQGDGGGGGGGGASSGAAGDGSAGDGLLPIGGERAQQKSLPGGSAFSMITPAGEPSL